MPNVVTSADEFPRRHRNTSSHDAAREIRPIEIRETTATGRARPDRKDPFRALDLAKVAKSRTRNIGAVRQPVVEGLFGS